MRIKLYTTHCPKCNVLVKKLEASKIKFEEVTDVDVMLDLGFTQVPMLEVDGAVMNYTDAIKWISK